MLISLVWVISFIICFPPLIGWGNGDADHIDIFSNIRWVQTLLGKGTNHCSLLCTFYLKVNMFVFVLRLRKIMNLFSSNDNDNLFKIVVNGKIGLIHVISHSSNRNIRNWRVITRIQLLAWFRSELKYIYETSWKA